MSASTGEFMIRIADLLDRDFSKPIEDVVKVHNDDPDTVFTELSEYIATDRIKAEYERLLSAIAAAPKSPNQCVGVWISGCFGSGKSSFAKNLGYVLANRDVRGVAASSLFLKQMDSTRLTEYVEFLNRAVPYEMFLLDVQMDQPAPTNAEQIAEVMYRAMLRSLDYAEDCDISELEIELERKGELAAFQDLCLAEYKEEWRKVREGSRKFVHTGALLHRLDSRTYASTDTWLNTVKSRPSSTLSVEDLVEKSFDLCEIRRPGKTFAFIMDDMGQFAALGSDRLESLCAVVEQFGRRSFERLKAGKLRGPVWIVVTAQEKLQEVCNRLAAGRTGWPKLQDRFWRQIELPPAGIPEVVARRVLRKKQSQEFILRTLFRDSGASLIQNVKLERCLRSTDFDEDRFVRFYPYLPHLIDLSIDIAAGIQLHPNAPKEITGANRTILKQVFEMLASDPARLADRPVGALVSVDKIYDVVEGSIPPSKRKDILDLRERFDSDEDYPRMAARVAKAICLMEFAKTDLPRTTKNIAALLIQRVAEAPPALAVAGILQRLKEAGFVRETEDGWKLGDSDELRRAAASLERLGKAVGAINPRPPGWRNGLIQFAKKFLARLLAWYTRPLQEFNASASRSLEEIACAVDRLSANMASQFSWTKSSLDDLSTNMAALEARLAQLKNKNVELMQELELLREQLPVAGLQKTADPEAGAGGMNTNGDMRARGSSRFSINADARSDRTAYIIGLFGTGRRYINELMLQNIGERAQYFRDGIRLHPGPTPMIYSGHATIRHASRAQRLPAIMKGISEAVGSGFADLIFIYRHPLDSLLTNWVWWRTFIHDNRAISGISQVYRNTDDLCRDLERNFFEFKAFAEGDPDFFAASPGPPFLSFAEFVEETELHLQSAPLALRLEDFAIGPLKEFSKILKVMSLDLDLSGLCVVPPVTRPYGYLAVEEKAPRFRDFIDGLDTETKIRIEKIGYNIRS